MTRNMQEMSWQDFSKMKNESVLMLPIGSTEQHGPHLPLSVDTIISSSLAVMIAEKVNGIVAPTVCYGYKSLPGSGGGPLFPGTVDLNGNTFMHLIKDIIEEFIRDGVKSIFILNGHFENEPFILEAIDIISKNENEKVKIVVASWWNHISPDVMNKIFDENPFPGWELEHAAIAETSLMMKFCPELVHMELIKEEVVQNPQNYHVYPVLKDRVHPSGMLSTCKSSSAEKGDLLANEIVAELTSIINKELIL